MSKVGRKTDLTSSLIKEIKQAILDGNNLKDTAIYIFHNSADISDEERKRGVDNYIQKLYNWNCDNYLNINDKMEGWKRDRKLMLADRNIDSILTLGISDDKALKVVADMSKFVKETLDKKNYSKQVNTDITSNGESIGGFNYITPTNENNNTDNKTTSQTTHSLD